MKRYETFWQFIEANKDGTLREETTLWIGNEGEVWANYSTNESGEIIEVGRWRTRDVLGLFLGQSRIKWRKA